MARMIRWVAQLVALMVVVGFYLVVVTRGRPMDWMNW
jgi:hypothetical protein